MRPAVATGNALHGMRVPPNADLGDPRLYARCAHHEIWRRDRREQPVKWLESETQGAFWSVTSHAAATRVLEDPRTFVSSQGMRLGAGSAGVAAAADRMLVVSDEDAHARIRSAHAPWFTSVNAKRVGDVVRDFLDTQLQHLATGQPVDVVDALSDAVPICVMAEMMGMGLDETGEVSRLVRATFAEPTSVGEEGSPEPAAASARVFAYFYGLVRARRADPGDDMVSQLMRPLSDGKLLSSEELLLNCDGVVNGGLGTSRHAVSGTIEAFARHPSQWDRLRADPSLVRSAVEEVLRWACPPMHVMRTAVVDVDLMGTTIRSGDRVVVWLPSCNRDETVFDDADSFRIDRRPNPHLSFGGGPHYCIGAAIGRLEIRVLLQVMLERVESVELCEDPVHGASTFLNGAERLVVKLTPRRTHS